MSDLSVIVIWNDDEHSYSLNDSCNDYCDYDCDCASAWWWITIIVDDSELDYCIMWSQFMLHES